MNAAPKPKRRWMTVLLVSSLALNLLVVGVAVGTVLRLKDGDHTEAPPGFGPALYRALPKDDRKALRGELSALREKDLRGRRQDFQALSLALRRVPFDPFAVEVLLQQQSQATAELQLALQTQWLARVTAMSDAERQSYADRLQKIVERGPHGHKKKD